MIDNKTYKLLIFFMNYDIIISADNAIQNEDMYMIEYKHYVRSYEAEVL